MSPWPESSRTVALMSDGSATSTSPFSVVNDIGFPVTRVKCAFTSPFAEWMMPVPATFVRLMSPFMLFTSRSPSTRSTMMSSPFISVSLSDVRTGTRIESAVSLCICVEMRISLFSSSMVRPLAVFRMRRSPACLPLPRRSSSSLSSSVVSTMTLLASWPLTTILPLIRLTMSLPGRDGSVNATLIFSPLADGAGAGRRLLLRFVGREGEQAQAGRRHHREADGGRDVDACGQESTNAGHGHYFLR